MGQHSNCDVEANLLSGKAWISERPGGIGHFAILTNALAAQCLAENEASPFSGSSNRSQRRSVWGCRACLTPCNLEC